MTFGGFDASDHGGSGDRAEFGPLPYGWYSARITSAEMKFTKAGDGKYISVSFRLPTQNRMMWNNYNWENKNPQAVSIGKEQLAELCVAIGKPVIASLKDLEQGECSILLGISEWQGKQRNEVKGSRPGTADGPPEHGVTKPGQGGGAGPRSVPAAAAQAFADDDIPF